MRVVVANGRRAAAFAVVAVALAAGGGASAAGTAPIYWGALIQGSLYGLPDPGTDTRAIAAFEAHAGRGVSIVHLGQSWYGNGVAKPFPADQLEAVRLHGAIPLLSWGSRDSSLSDTNSPSFRNSAITSGSYDAFIRSFATAARDWGHPFFLRFDWEMNGWWYPWGQGQIGTTGQIVNGNSPGDYIRMWQHVHDIFEQVGATNVTWVWCINQMSQTTSGVHPPMSEIYPGDTYVDWSSYDAYNRYSGWEDFNTMSTGAGTSWLLDTYHALTDVAPTKPVMLAEFGSKEDLANAQRKPAWLTDALATQIPANFPKIKAVVYYNRNNTTDVVNDPDATVAIESSAQSQAAFANGINSGYYASNTFTNLPAGRIQPLQQSVAATPPDPPALTSAAGARSVTLQWPTPAGNGSPVSGYRVYRGTAPGAETLLATVGAANSYLDAEVAVGRSYSYTVAAMNDAGVGAPSNEVTATPTGAGLLVSDRFDRSVTAGLGNADTGGAWTVSATTRTKVAGSEGVVYGWSGGNQDVAASGGTSVKNMEALALVRLSAANPVGGSYSPRVVVRAQTDARNGYGARISHTSTGGLTWLLSRIDNAGGTGSLSLASGTLATAGAAGTRWWIRLRAQGTTIQAKFWRDATPEPATWTATASDSYWNTGRAAFGVYAGVGLSSPFPDTGFATFDAVDLDHAALPTAPAAPALTSVTGGDGTVTVAWSAPSSDGGSPVTGYKVYRGTSSGAETLFTSLGVVGSYTDASVTNGVTYWYRVTAVNAVGESPVSSERSVTPQAAGTVPAAPALSSATGGNGSVTIRWSPPSSDGGSPVTGYRVYRGTSSGAEALLASVGAVSTYTDTAVVNGTTYWYVVTAVNAVGESSASNEGSALPQAVASPPTAPVVSSATAGDGSVTVAWSPPSSDGGSSVTGYNVYRGTSSGTETLLASLGVTGTYTDAAVTNGVTYWYRVTAVNVVGESPVSNERSVTPQVAAAAPSAPLLTSATAGSGSVAIGWSAPSSDGGSPVTGYKVYRGTSSGAETLLTSLGVVGSYTDASVTNGVTYWYRVTAVNAAGESAVSNERSATPQPVATVPAAPALTSATGGDGTVTIGWSAPSSDGGSPVTGYRVYRGTSSGAETLLASLGVVGSYTDASVTNGVTYWYRVAAVNAVGESPLSNERSAAPKSPTVFVADTFDRTVASGFGAAAVGGTWSVSSTSQTKVQTSEGVVYGVGAGQDVRASIGTAVANQELLGLVRLNATNPVGGSYDARVVARAQTDTRRGYVVRLTHASTGAVTWTLALVKNVNGGGGTVTLGSGTLDPAGAGTSWWIRLRAQGTSISVKLWRDGTAEPTPWTRAATDSTFAAGTVSLGVTGGTGLTQPVDVGFGSIQATNLG